MSCAAYSLLFCCCEEELEFVLDYFLSCCCFIEAAMTLLLKTSFAFLLHSTAEQHTSLIAERESQEQAWGQFSVCA